MTDGRNNALLVLLDLSAAFDTPDDTYVAPPETLCRNQLGWFRSLLVIIILVMQVTVSPCRTCSGGGGGGGGVISKGCTVL